MKSKISLLGIGFILLKIGPKLSKVFFGLAKSLKLILFGGSAASYTVIFGWKAALMILISLFVHESGHLWAMKNRGMKTKGLYFIPFLGAAAVAEEEFPSRETENYVALMGPTVGLSLAVVTYSVFLMTNDLEFAAAAGWMALINLLNLLPIMPLDGGRVLKSISFSVSSRMGIISVIAGMIAGGFFALQNGFLLFVVLIPIGMIETLADLLKEKKRLKDIKFYQKLLAEVPAYKQVTIERDIWSLADTYHIKREEMWPILQDLPENLKQLRVLDRLKMNPKEIGRSIFWTAILVFLAFSLIQSAAKATFDVSFLEILR